MSDLDEKLDSIIDELANKANSAGQKGHAFTWGGGIDWRELTKQAFIDAGWSAPVEYDKPPKQIFGKPIPVEELKPTLVMGGAYHDAFIDAVKKEAGLLTGQEWYDRFENALRKYGQIDTEDGDNVDVAERVACVYLQAAREAAGIDE